MNRRRRHSPGFAPCIALLSAALSASAVEPPQPTPTPTDTPPAAVPITSGTQTWQGEIVAGAAKIGFVAKLTAGVDGKPASGTLDIPIQGVRGSELKDVTISDDVLKFTFVYPGTADAVMEMKVDAANASKATGTITQGGASFPLSASRLKEGEAPKGPDRPQNPVPPYPYEVGSMKFPGGAEGVLLSGTITFPKGPGPFPGVVLVSGSGPQDRDETLLGHKPFLVLADALTRAGVAVLRYDDRGVGASTGDFASATTDDFANDAEKAVAALAVQANVDPKRIGIMGHSEGGLIAPMVASRNEGVAFIVLLAGPGTNGKETLRDQIRAIQVAGGVPQENADKQVEVQQLLLQQVIDGAPEADLKSSMRRLMMLQSGVMEPTEEQLKQVPDDAVNGALAGVSSPWMKRFLVTDPRPFLRKVKVPVLALNGELDTQVIAKINLPEIRKALDEAGNTDVTILGINGVNHLFQTATTGSPGEYASISETFSPGAMAKITSWVRQRTGLEPMPAAEPGAVKSGEAKLPEGKRQGD
jgi:pimeloyl-ACP methyl ester carboxylesterase